MKYIPLTRGKFATVDDEDFDYLNQWKWLFMASGKYGYAGRRKWNGVRQDLVLMHRLVLRTPYNMVCDHKYHGEFARLNFD